MSSVIEIRSSDSRRNISRSSCGRPSSAAVTRVGNSNVTALTRSTSPSSLNSSTSWSQIGSITSGSHCVERALPECLRAPGCDGRDAACRACRGSSARRRGRSCCCTSPSANTSSSRKAVKTLSKSNNVQFSGFLSSSRHQVALHERAAPHRRGPAHVRRSRRRDRSPNRGRCDWSCESVLIVTRASRRQRLASGSLYLYYFSILGQGKWRWTCSAERCARSRTCRREP